MKPDWDKLADEYKDSPTVLIADVDCTASGKPLCEKNGVKGYPTIKTFAAGDEEGTAYEGGRTFDDLKKHAESLGPSCSIDNKELCSAEQLPMLEKYAAMSQARRDAKLVKLKKYAHDCMRRTPEALHSVHTRPVACVPAHAFHCSRESLLVSLHCSQVPVYSFIAHYMAMLSHCSPTDPHSFSITHLLSLLRPRARVQRYR